MRKQGHGTSASQTDGSTGPESRVGATLLSGGRGPPTATTPSDLLATTGQQGYRDLAQIVGCSPSTFGLWLNKFLDGGITELLRRETPPGSTSPIGATKVQQELVAGLKSPGGGGPRDK